MGSNDKQMKSKTKFTIQSLNSSTLSLVLFMTEWNGASQITSMIYADLSSSYYGSIQFYTVNIEKEKQLSDAFGIMEVPAILFFRNGELIDHAIGLISKNALIGKIETALSNPNSK
jgi:thioredoxin 1